MKQFIVKFVVVAVGLGASLTAQNCEAADHDLRVGSFQGNWCGLPARFDIQQKIGNTWKFKGKIWIKATGQYDKIEIEQFADNSLRIVRFLAGEHNGKHQTLSTHRPETLLKNGHKTVNYRAKQGYGIGTNNLGHLLVTIGY